MFWICSRPAPPELMPGSIVFTIFAASGSRSVVFFAAVGLADPVVDGVHAATMNSTSSDSAASFFILTLPAGNSRPLTPGKDTTPASAWRENTAAGPTKLAPMTQHRGSSRRVPR